MNRRTFLNASVLIGSVAAAIGAWQLFRPVARRGARERDKSVLARLIRSRIPALLIPAAILEEFVQDHEAKYGKFKGKKVSHDLVQDFLLSTDFFPAADESKPLGYVIYHDPFNVPCRNPFRT